MVEVSDVSKIGEPLYSRSVFEDLLAALGPNEFDDRHFVLDDKGVWVKALSAVLAWHPKSETMMLGGPNAVDEPWLPFPFTPRQLAALLFGGRGLLIQDFYGEWAEGPGADALARIPSRGDKAREVVKLAYAACREAIELAPELDAELEQTAQALQEKWNTANRSANDRENVLEPNISSIEYSKRRARAVRSSESLSQRHSEARARADLAYTQWRRAVVQHLLLPVHEIAGEAFRDEQVRSLPAQRREEALHQIRAYGDFQDTPIRAEQWRLLSERKVLVAQLIRWKAMAVVSPSDAVAQEEKVSTLSAQLDAVEDQLSRRTDGDVRVGAVGREDEGQRQRRRLTDFRRLGGAWVKRSSEWGAKDRQSGAFARLEEQEQSNGSKCFSAKSIRKDLTVAAEAEVLNSRIAALPSLKSFP